MLVPSNRLLLFMGIIGIPVFTLLGMAEAPLPVLIVAVLMTLVLLGLDAPSALASLHRLRVEFPPLLRTSKGRTVTLEATVVNKDLYCRLVTLGLPLPSSLHVEEPLLSLSLQKGKERNIASWSLLAVERGNYRLEKVHLEGISRFGFWQGRRAVSISTEIRVYPDLSHERHVLAPLFFRRGTMGIHNVRQIGKGREFEQLRDYAPGDGYEDIYWKGTAKRRFPITKMYQLERTQEIYVALDCSRRSARRLTHMEAGEKQAGMVAKTQLERFIQAALVLALAAEQQTDKFGLILFSDQVHRIIPAGGGRGHYDVIRDVLYTLQPNVVSPDFEDVFIHIGNRLRQRALLLFLTDLGEPWLAESFVEGVALISRRHVTLTHMLGQKEVQPMFQKNDAVEDDAQLYEKLAGQLMWNDLQETTRLLKQRSVHLTSSLQENLVADVVSEYLKVKQRQLI